MKRDGGAFDQLTGATITPRAIVKAVKKSLLYYREHRADLYVESVKSDAKSDPVQDSPTPGSGEANKQSGAAQP